MREHHTPDGHRQGGRPQRRISPALVLGLGIVAVSTASTFIRLAQAAVPSLALAAWRLSFATLMVAPLALTTSRQEWRRLGRRQWWLVIASGIFLALHFYTWIASLAMTSVAASVALVSTNPLFVGLISHFALQERLRPATIVGMIVAVAGSAIIGISDLEAGSHQLLGDLLALVGALTVAVYLLIGRRLRGQLSLLAYIFPVYGTAALVLMVLSLVTRTPLLSYPPQMWLWLVLVALIPQVIGHSSFNWALGHLPATFVALTVLAEPVGSTVLAWWVLEETPTRVTVYGGLLILVGIAIATWRRKADKNTIPKESLGL